MEHIKVWQEEGIIVDVVTSVPNFPKGKVYPGYRNKLYQVQNVEGVSVHRVWTYISQNAGVLRRIVDYLSFCFSSFIAGLFIKTDLIVATSPQFFTAVSGWLLATVKRSPWIFEVRDIWPESIVAVGAITNRTIIWSLEVLEKFLYRRADRIVVVTASFKQNLVSRGINERKIDVVPNGVIHRSKNTGDQNLEMRKQLGLDDKFVIGYMGTHGMAHGLDFILRAAQNILDTRVHFLFIGDGAEKQKLLALKDQLGLTNVTFLPPVSKSEVWEYISTFDVALVPLRKSDTFKSVIPSKIFESAAAGLPILLGVEGESRALIEKYDCGVSFEPENEQSFLDAIKGFLNEGVLVSDLKEGAIRLAADFDRRKMAKEYMAIFNKID
jgi:glycosyltransferase involved in cell wall biosynthesis